MLNVFRLVASEYKTELIVSHTVKDEFTMHKFMHIDKMTSTLLVPFLTCSAGNSHTGIKALSLFTVFV